MLCISVHQDQNVISQLLKPQDMLTASEASITTKCTDNVINKWIRPTQKNKTEEKEKCKEGH